MDIETLSAIADKKIQVDAGPFQSFRQKHLKSFKAQGFSVSDQDFYKFTNMASFFQNLKFEPKTHEIDLQNFTSHEFPTLVFVDGILHDHSVSVPGVKISSLKIDGLNPEGIRSNALTHLHHSLLGDGVVIDVEKNTVLKKPLRVLFLSTKESPSAPTLVVNAAPFSEITILEESRSLLSGGPLISESYFHLSSGSKVEHIQIAEGSLESIRHGSTYASVEKDANYRNVVFHLGGRLNRQNLDLKLLAPGSHGESYNLYLTDKNEHSDINTVIEHTAPDSTSKQLAKGILDGESKGIFTGKIHIFKDAQRVSSGQLNKNLLLSKKAQAHSQPQLEIFADDVKCSHGSTTGQLAPEELFYFQARGIPEDKARTLLAHGFGLEVVLKIENLEARNLVSALVLQKLKEKFQLGGNL